MRTRAFLCVAPATAALGLLIAAALFGGSARKADAAPVGVSKTLCAGTNCGLSSVSPTAPVYYKITLSAPSSTSTTVSDQLPPGFVLTGTNPTCTSGSNTVSATTPSISGPINTGQTISFSLTVAPGPNTVCILNGYFSLAVVTQLTNTVTATDPSNASISASWVNNLNLATPIPGNVAAAKSASTNAANVTYSAQTVTYTITVTNTGSTDLNLGTVLRLEDRLKLNTNSVPLVATYVNSTCTVSAPTPPQNCVVTAPPSVVNTPKTVNSLSLSDFVAWRYPASGLGSAGLLKAGSVMTVTLVMKIDRIPGLDCVIQAGADGIFNVAHIALNLPPVSGPGPGTALSDAIPSDNTSLDIPLTVTTGSTIVDPACGYGYFPPSPVLQVQKIQTQPTPGPNPLPWPSNVEYKIIVQNISTNVTVSKMNLEDITAEGVGTPPFTSEAITYNYCAPICSNPTMLPAQQLLGYGDSKAVFKTQLFQPPASTTSLGPGQSEAFTVRVNYRLPDCDSYQSIQPKPIYNIARVTGWVENGTTPVSTIVQATATTMMKPPPPCNLQVTKADISGSPPRIHFAPATRQYKVIYKNLDAIPHTVGTLIDTMRMTTSNYAAQLNVSSTYKCTPTGAVIGFPTTNPSWPTPDPATVVFTSLAQQGVRLIQNTTPVVFPPGSSLTCVVTVTVQKPPSNDPFCATNGALDNTGIMDTSQFYNPNLAWGNSVGTYHAGVTRPLPKCFGPVVNKVASPLWTWSGGGPVTFTVTINDPPTYSAIPIGPEFVDTIAPQLATTGNPNFVCTGGGCLTAWGPLPAPPGAGNVMGQSLIRVNALPSNSTTTAQYVVTNTSAYPYPPPGGQICNEIYGRMRPPLGPQALDFFWKNPSTSNANETTHVKACVPVVQTGTIMVKKLVTIDSGFTAPSPPTTFTITVQCQNGSYPIPASTLTLGANGSATIPGIPVSSSCTTSEVVPPAVPTPGKPCQLQGWFPPVITPNPLSPTTGGTMTITVKNRYGCLAASGTVMLHKTVTSSAPYIPPPPYVFPITVSCQNPMSSATVNILGGVTIQINGITAGATCTTTEVLPGPTGDPVCASVGWSPPVITPNPFTAPNSGTMTINVQNHYGCLTAPSGGTISVVKSVVANPGWTPPPAATFPVTVQCQNGSTALSPYTANVTASSGAQFNNVPTGSTCTTSEVVPPPFSLPALCASVGWFPPVIAPNPLTPTTNGTMTISVQNRYGCLTAPSSGTIAITKSVITNTGYTPPANATFPVTVQCQNGSTVLPPYTATVSASSGAQINNVPTGSTCTTSEVLPPPISTPGVPCQSIGWFPPVITPNPLTSTTSGTMTISIQNHYGCLTPVNGTGSVVVNKVVVSAPPFTAPPTTFTVTLQCPFIPLQTATVVGGGAATFSNIPGGLSCTVAEAPLPPLIPTPVCAHLGWAAVQISPNAVTVPPFGTAVVTVTNRYGCQP